MLFTVICLFVQIKTTFSLIMYNIFDITSRIVCRHQCLHNEKWLYIYMLADISLNSVLFSYLDIIIFNKLSSTYIHAVVWPKDKTSLQVK